MEERPFIIHVGLQDCASTAPIHVVLVIMCLAGGEPLLGNIVCSCMFKVSCLLNVLVGTNLLNELY